MVGGLALGDKELVRRVDRLGHTGGSHTWSHANQGGLSRAAADKEIELGVSAVTAALGKPIAPFFRFPYLSDPKASIRHLESRNLGIFSIDVDSYDFRTRNGAVMKQNVLSQLQKKGKGIILFHDIQRSTAAGLGDLLDELKRRKFKVVHMVPKVTAATVAAYDAIAAKDLARRTAMVAAKPLSSRSMVWPVTAGDAKVSATVARPEGPAALPWKAPGSTGSVQGAANAAAQPPAAGAAMQQTGAIAPSAARAPRPSWKREELPWQEQMWNHYR